MAEPTSALTYSDLILAVAEQLGVAYYGAAGVGAAQIPIDAYELDRCKRFVQDGIRMFIADSPPAGWRWQRPLASVVLWADIAQDAAVTVTGAVYAAPSTTITASAATFYPSMVGATIVIATVGSFVISSYTSSTVVVVTGDASAAAADVFSMTSGGVFAMPQTFGGETLGDLTYAAGSNNGTTLRWCNELEIRRYRESGNGSSGTPFLAAIRRNQTNSRRWDLVAYPTPSADETVEFPYLIYFDVISALTDMHVAGFAHDESVKWAAKSQAEMQGEDAMAGATEYYRKISLPNSWKTDLRSAPRRLGYCGSGLADDNSRQYTTVVYL